MAVSAERRRCRQRGVVFAARSNCRSRHRAAPSTLEGPSIASGRGMPRRLRAAAGCLPGCPAARPVQPVRCLRRDAGLARAPAIFSAMAARSPSARARALARGNQGIQLLGGRRPLSSAARYSPAAPQPSSGRRPVARSRCRAQPSAAAPGPDWPCTTTRCSPSSASTPTGALRPPTMARLRPSGAMVRPRIERRRVASRDPGRAFPRHPVPEWRQSRRRRPATAPRRRRNRRPPAAPSCRRPVAEQQAERSVTTMVLPAPVSPALAVNPGPSGRAASGSLQVADRIFFDHASWSSSRPGPRHR